MDADHHLCILFFFRLHTHTHTHTKLGSHAACLYNLQTFGIPVGCIPIDDIGTVHADGYRQFLHKRYLQEQQWKAANNNNNNNATTGGGGGVDISKRISVPARSDVLSGRGKGYFSHVGNVRYRSLIEDLKSKYDKASKEDKHKITQEVVEIVHQSGGRFLKDDGAGWVLVEEEVARLKVSHSFRAARKASIASSSSSSSSTAAVKFSSSSREIEGLESPGKRMRAA
jgi:hypothetical protein